MGNYDIRGDQRPQRNQPRRFSNSIADHSMELVHAFRLGNADGVTLFASRLAANRIAWFNRIRSGSGRTGQGGLSTRAAADLSKSRFRDTGAAKMQISLYRKIRQHKSIVYF
jgi:hypothetical protein